jgi:hypothetical protein
MSPQDKATTERHARTLRELVKRPENRVCADCKHNGIPILPTFSLCFYAYSRALRPPLGLLEYVRSRVFFPPWASLFALVVYFYVFAALVFTVEWAPISAKSSLSILTHGHLSRWKYVISPLPTSSSLMNMQDRTYNNGAIASLTCTGKHISNRAMFPQISEYRFLV